MAKSYSHTYGEIIGDFFEKSIIRYLKPIVDGLGFYCDYKHSRSARHGRREVWWSDDANNKHKLDIVVEENGNEDVIGMPKAFVEVAWRRYSKHAKNKAQEISGAILPIVRKYKNAPFYAAVLAGDFSENSIEQLDSEGFTVCHVTIDEMDQIMHSVGLTVKWQENTPESIFKEYIDKFRNLSEKEYNCLYDNFIRVSSAKLESFKNTLLRTLTRKLKSVIVTPMHGSCIPFDSIQEARDFIYGYDQSVIEAPVLYYEIKIVFTTDDEYSCKCKAKRDAIEFLNKYL